MSVSGEFQRYLAAAIEALGGGNPGKASDPGFAALLTELEAAGADPETPLAERARQSLEALGSHGLLPGQKESPGHATDPLPAIRESAADLASISRIVLGRDAPPAG